jgi:para-nitrobenzyl esterase
VWVNFITNGGPGWAAYDTASRATGLLTDAINAIDDPAAGERARWDGIR